MAEQSELTKSPRVSLDRLESLFECVICLYMPDGPPVYQCRHGHILCKTCRPKCKTCPCCKDFLGENPVRNRAVEKYISDLAPSRLISKGAVPSEGTSGARMFDPSAPPLIDARDISDILPFSDVTAVTPEHGPSSPLLDSPKHDSIEPDIVDPESCEGTCGFNTAGSDSQNSTEGRHCNQTNNFEELTICELQEENVVSENPRGNKNVCGISLMILLAIAIFTILVGVILFFTINTNKECDCYKWGSKQDICNNTTGQCLCKEGFDESSRCDRCEEGYFGFPNCRRCSCSAKGSMTNHTTTCDQLSGQCSCKANIQGRQCDECMSVHFGFPNCNRCDCEELFSKPEACDKETGECFCKELYNGDSRCGKCTEEYFGYPKCEYCNCSKEGSASSICNPISGKCPCNKNFNGLQCSECAKGYFHYPECKGLRIVE